MQWMLFSEEPRPHAGCQFLALAARFLGAACCILISTVTLATPPERPMLLHEEAIMDDGMRLPLAWWRPAGKPRAVVLALHGFNDYRQAHAETAEVLAAHGILTVAYDQRGFGATTGRGSWPGGERLLADARAMLRLLRRAYPGRPLFIMGESMGGAVALALLGGGNPPVVDGAVLIAPAVWGRSTMPVLQRLALWLGARLMPGKTLTGQSLKIRASDNDEMLRRLWRDPLVIHASRIDTLYGLSNLMDRALAAAPGLRQPALILYGLHDEIIPKPPTCRMLATLPGEGRWRFVLYPHGYHMLTRDRQGHLVIADIAAWLEDPQGPLPSAREVPRQDLAQMAQEKDCSALWRSAAKAR